MKISNRYIYIKEKKEGFTLLELIITIAVISILTIMVAGWQINEFKEKKVKEIATTLLAIDTAMYQVDALIKNVNAHYNIPINPSWSSKTSSTWDSYICPVRNTKSWRFKPQYTGIGDVLVDNYLDPRIDTKKLASEGYRLEFIKQSGKIKYIKVYGLDGFMAAFLHMLIPDNFDASSRLYKLNKGNGYPYTSFNYTCN